MCSIGQQETCVNNKEQLFQSKAECRKDAYGNRIEKGKKFKVTFKDEISTNGSRSLIDIIEVTSFKEENEFTLDSAPDFVEDKDDGGSYKSRCFIL